MVTVLSLVFVCVSAFLAQASGSDLSFSQRVTISSAVSPETARPGDSVTLSVAITPKKDVRLFAPGASQFTAVALAVTPPRGYSLGRPEYPIPERQSVPGTNKRVPVYDTKVEVKLPVTISKNAKPGETLRIPGMLTYQTCDERVTYRRSSVPIVFTVKVE
jgi:DsbC/DsbD-like thiol-disulfide interchange protein